MWNFIGGTSFFLLFSSVLAFVAIIAVYIYYFKAVWLVHLLFWYGKWRADLKKHCLKITDELEISYLERRGDTDGQVLLFIHGVTIYKEMFCVIAWYFPRKFHIILIDLPGHGESKPNDKDSDYRPSVLVECVHQFVEAYGFGKKKLNIIGLSMGGAVAGLYTARYSHEESLSSAVLICPPGIHSPQSTEFFQYMRDNVSKNVRERLLIPSNLKEFYDMLKLIAYQKVNIPSQVGKAYVKLKHMKADVDKKALSDMNIDSEYLLLDQALEDIKHPILCVWGENDEIFHVSGCEVIKERVKNAEVHIFDRCGHAITLDRPRKLVKTITQFLDRVTTN